MFITYNPNTPATTKEIQYILDGSNTLENIQGRMVLPLPKGINPLDIYSASDITAYDPILNLADILGYDSVIESDNYWRDPLTARTKFVSSGITSSILTLPTSVTSYSIVASLGKFSADGCNLSPVDSSKVVIHTKITTDPDGTAGGLPEKTKETEIITTSANPKILSGYSTPFVFVTSPHSLDKNPPVVSFEVTVKYNHSTPVNLLYWGVMYNS